MGTLHIILNIVLILASAALVAVPIVSNISAIVIVIITENNEKIITPTPLEISNSCTKPLRHLPKVSLKSPTGIVPGRCSPNCQSLKNCR